MISIYVHVIIVTRQMYAREFTDVELCPSVSQETVASKLRASNRLFPMSKEASRAWGAVIQQLEAASSADEPSLMASLASLGACLGALLQQIDSMPALPRAVWKILITKTQVPFQLWAVWQHLPHEMQYPLDGVRSMLAHAVIDTLEAFLRGAARAGIICRPEHTTNSLSLNIGRQLEQAGFLQHFPGMIAAAAEQLEALQDRPNDSPNSVAAGVADATYGQLNSAQWGQCWGARLTRLQALVSQMQWLFTALHDLWPKDQLYTKVWPSLVAPAAQLLLRVLQHVSLCLEQLPADMKQPPFLLRHLLVQSCDVANRVMVPVAFELLCPRPIAPLQQQQQQQLMGLPYSVPVFSLMLMIAAYAQLLELQSAADSTHTARSTGSTDIQKQTPHSSEPMGQADSDLWQFVNDHHHLLPALHDKLLQALCCSSKAVVWAAALARAENQPVKCPDMKALLDIYTQLGLHKVHCMMIKEEEQAWHTSMRQQQIAVGVECCPVSLGQGQLQQQLLLCIPGEQALHLLLPSVLLLWAAEMPSSGRDYIMLCNAIGGAGVVGIRCWTCQEDLRRQCKFELLQAQSDAAQSDASEESSSRAACHWQAAPNRLLLAYSVEEALHCLQAIVQKLLCLAASGSDSESSSRSRETAREEACPTVTAYDAFHELLRYLCALGKAVLWRVEARLAVNVWPSSVVETGHLSDSTSGAEMIDFAAANAAAVALSKKHAKHIYSLIEAFVRLQASQPRGTLLTINAGLPMLCSRASSGDGSWHLGGLLQSALTSGPGSLEQLRLFSLLCSMLKFGASLGPLQQGPATGCNLAAALAAASILQGAASQAQHCWQLPQGGSTSAVTYTVTAATSSANCACPHTGFEAASQQPGADSAAPSTNAAGPLVGAMLPWLHLLGRCCLGWAQQLVHQPAGQHAYALRGAILPVLQSDSILDLFMTPMHGIAIPASCLDSCRSWLGIRGIAAQLAAMGYDSGLLQLRLQSASAAVATAAVASAEGAVAPAEAVAELVQQLQALGLSLCTLAISHACNNPFCSNSTGPSERELVKGSSHTCAGCRAARYCCKACQKQHWKQHKPVCKALAAVGAELSKQRNRSGASE